MLQARQRSPCTLVQHHNNDDAGLELAQRHENNWYISWSSSGVDLGLSIFSRTKLILSFSRLSKCLKHASPTQLQPLLSIPALPHPRVHLIYQPLTSATRFSRLLYSMWVHMRPSHQRPLANSYSPLAASTTSRISDMPNLLLAN